MPIDHATLSVSNQRAQNITILGATGSVGLNTLDVISRHPERYSVFALSGMTQIGLLTKLCLLHRPQYAVVTHEQDARALQNTLLQFGTETLVLVAEAGLETIAAHPQVDTVVSAIVGAAGLKPTLAAVNAGKKILLANKEALVMSGALFMQAVRRSAAILLPIDSEHNAIFQCLHDGHARTLADAGVRRIVLTASGGPFRSTPLNAMNDITPDQACAHPTWPMGRKISVDSATMMNKGLELIEACWLFDATPDQVEVVIHPQSVIHSLVDYVDGSMLAQLGNPDMRTPISHALAWPERIDSGVKPLDLCDVARLDFEPPDENRFPCLALARQVAQWGGTAPATLNAANEVAVEAFLSRRIGFTQIAQVIGDVLDQMPVTAANDLETVLAADAKARSLSIRWLAERDK
ncbi:1-deoxy-D-xylulose-5-phosphate reductoisomerase [Pseudomonas sp. NPDC085632]|uniref:1-deoxy-D-xylulose-5-phosphate reductoisomerase n=1 Tax=Pseudomonas sp. NPDC085632 TaxID=3364429 RepID=UPI0037C8959C